MREGHGSRDRPGWYDPTLALTSAGCVVVSGDVMSGGGWLSLVASGLSNCARSSRVAGRGSSTGWCDLLSLLWRIQASRSNVAMSGSVEGAFALYVPHHTHAEEVRSERSTSTWSGQRTSALLNSDQGWFGSDENKTMLIVDKNVKTH